MKLSDIVALAKSGYSVSDIKELVALGEEAESKEVEQSNVEPEQNGINDEGMSDDSTEDSHADVSRETLEARIKSLEEQLAKAQSENTRHTDVSGDMKDADELLTEMLEGYI